MFLHGAYVKVLSKLYQGTTDDSAWDEALVGIAALVGGEGPLLMSSRHDASALTRHRMYSYDPEVFADYGKYWLAHDSRVPLAARKPELSVFTEESLLGRRNWLRTPIYNEFLKPSDAPWVLASPLHSNEHRFTLLCIQGTRRRGPFGPDDATMISPLLRHVRRALEIKDRFDHQQVHADSLRDAADRLPFGVVILDERQRVMEASSFAAAAIESLCLVPLRRGERLHLPEPAQHDFSLLIASGLAKGRLSDGLLHASRGPARLPVSILVMPAPATSAGCMGPLPRWILWVFDAEQRLLPAAAVLEKDLGLSPREAQVAAMLAAGFTPPQIARQLDISLNTLRTHLKTCYLKTGGRSRNTLLARVLAGPAQLTASRRAD